MNPASGEQSLHDDTLSPFVEGLLARARAYGHLRIASRAQALTKRYRLSRRWSWGLELRPSNLWVGLDWGLSPHLVPDSQRRHPAYERPVKAFRGRPPKLPADLDVWLCLVPMLAIHFVRVPA